MPGSAAAIIRSQCLLSRDSFRQVARDRLVPVAVAFGCIAAVEGAIGTWGVVYLRRRLTAGFGSGGILHRHRGSRLGARAAEDGAAQARNGSLLEILPESQRQRSAPATPGALRH